MNSRSIRSRLGQDRYDILGLASQLDTLTHDALCNRHLLRMMCSHLDHLLGQSNNSNWIRTQREINAQNTVSHAGEGPQHCGVEEGIGHPPSYRQLSVGSISESSIGCVSDTEFCSLSAAASEITLPSPRIGPYDAKANLRSKSLDIHTAPPGAPRLAIL